jgi:hypothetical protein
MNVEKGLTIVMHKPVAQTRMDHLHAPVILVIVGTEKLALVCEILKFS